MARLKDGLVIVAATLVIAYVGWQLAAHTVGLIGKLSQANQSLYQQLQSCEAKSKG